MKTMFTLLAVAAMNLALLPAARAGDLVFGCASRPACGKICKLVCEEKTLVSVGYGCKCDTVCIPGPSCQGCKHCDVQCCCDTPAAVEGCPPKIEFCWYDWCARGCAAPRTVKVLTKFQAERKICWYHWEVVDACGCGCDPGCGCGCVYKPAPTDAQVGSALPLTGGEQIELASWMAADSTKRNAELADAFNLPETTPESAAQAPAAAATNASEKPSLASRFSSLFKLGK